MLRDLRAEKNENYDMSFRNQAEGGVKRCGGEDGQWFGTAIYALARTGVAKGAYRDQRPGDGEKRGWNCVHSALGYTGCTSHITFNDPKDGGPYQVKQFRQYLTEVVREMEQRQPVYWGGDLYMRAEHIEDNFGGMDFWDHDRPGDWRCWPHGVPAWQSTAVNDRKVDWVFRTPSPPNLSCEDAYVFMPDDDVSDHAIVGGYL